MTFFPLISDASAQADPRDSQAISASPGVNVYRARRVQARAQSYEQRKSFPPPQEEAIAPPPPPPVQNQYAEPLRVSIPNVEEVPANLPSPSMIITRSTPENARFASPQPDEQHHSLLVDHRPPPPGIVDYAADAGNAVVSTLSNIGNFFVTAVSSAGESEPVAYARGPAAPGIRTAADSSVEKTFTAADIPAEPVPQATAPEAPPVRETYRSPGAIITREVVKLPLTPDVIASATPEQLAAYAPAAGEASAGVNEPLIAVPSATTPSESAPYVEPPLPTLTPLLNKSQPAPAVVDAAPPVATPADVEEVKKIVESSPDTPVSAQPETLPSLTAPPVETAPAPAPVVAAPEPVPTPAAAAIASEPTEGLSQESRNILNNLPRVADEKVKEPQSLDIDRARQNPDVTDTGVTGSDNMEASGVKIEIKTPSMNVNYELEKAYNALLSGQGPAAIEIYKRVLENEPGNSNALFGLATTYHRAGQIDKARPLYRKILAKDPNNREALNNFLVLLADEAPQEALTQLDALEQKNPDFSPIPAQMAVIYQKLGHPAKASEKMFKAVALAPENLTYRYNLAIMLDKQKNYDEAARLYRQIVQAHFRGENTPGNINKIQERLTFLSSNRH